MHVPTELAPLQPASSMPSGAAQVSATVTPMSEKRSAGRGSSETFRRQSEPRLTAKPSYADRRDFDQRGFAVRFGWGPNGLRQLAKHVDAVVVVDVLSFSTSVDVAVGRGVVVLPYKWHNGTEHEYAATRNAEVAGQRGEPGWTLAPASLTEAPSGLRLVLPSPNGSALTFGARDAGANRVHVGCLRNASATAAALAEASSIAVIAGGERWNGATGPMRPAIEDQIGAGAIIGALGRSSTSPEAMTAQAAWEGAADRLTWTLRECGSGRELRRIGDNESIALAAAVDVSTHAPQLVGEELVNPPISGAR